MELVCSVQEYAWGKQGSSSQVARYVPQLNRFVPKVTRLFLTEESSDEQICTLQFQQV